MSDELILVNKVNNVNVNIVCDFSIKMELKQYLSYYATNYKYHPKFKMRVWDGKISFFDIRNSLLPIGLLPQFHDFCQKFNYNYQFNFNINELKNEYSPACIDTFLNDLFKGTKFVPHDYQRDAIYKSLNNKRGLIESATSSGKSLIIYSIIKFLLTNNLLKRKILLIVPNKSLVEQMYTDFQDYGWKDIEQYCSRIYSEVEKDFTKKVTITTWQSMLKRDWSFFMNYDAVIIDEVHTATGDGKSVADILKKCINAEYRLGFTGTLPDEPCDLYNILGYIGPKIFDQTSKELMDRGIISKMKIANIIVKYPKEIVDKNKNIAYNDEVDLVIKSPARNKVFKYLFNNIPDSENTLILFNRIQHLKDTEDYLLHELSDKYSVFTIMGETQTLEREEVRKIIEQKNNVVLLATYGTMGTGVNMKKIHNIIFAGNSKSYSRVVQSIGRGLRKHDDKERLVVFDIVDDLTWTKRTGNIGKNYLYQHWEERLKYYAYQGFSYLSKEYQL